MKQPRNLSASDLARALTRLGYESLRQTGSHIRLATERDGVHRITIPNHDPIKPGTLSAILRLVATHHRMTREQIMDHLFK